MIKKAGEKLGKEKKLKIKSKKEQSNNRKNLIAAVWKHMQWWKWKEPYLSDIEPEGIETGSFSNCKEKRERRERHGSWCWCSASFIERQMLAAGAGGSRMWFILFYLFINFFILVTHALILESGWDVWYCVVGGSCGATYFGGLYYGCKPLVQRKMAYM